MTDFTALLPRIERLLDRLDTPAAAPALDWKNVRAARWSAQAGGLKPILHPQRTALKDLLAIDEQKHGWTPTPPVRRRQPPTTSAERARGCGNPAVKAVHAKYAAKGCA